MTRLTSSIPTMFSTSAYTSVFLKKRGDLRLHLLSSYVSKQLTSEAAQALTAGAALSLPKRQRRRAATEGVCLPCSPLYYLLTVCIVFSTAVLQDYCVYVPDLKRFSVDAADLIPSTFIAIMLTLLGLLSGCHCAERSTHRGCRYCTAGQTCDVGSPKRLHM